MNLLSEFAKLRQNWLPTPLLPSNRRDNALDVSATHFVETRTRSLTKTFAWRCFAVLNSFTILTMLPEGTPLANALAMNLTGFCLFYLFERAWNLIDWGRVPAKQEKQADGSSQG
ncbi:MAG: hypothetical protein WBD20_09215 [Pirellulaceae bacterium]